MNGLIISWLLAGLSASLIIGIIIYKQFGEIDRIDVVPILLSFLFGWISILVIFSGFIVIFIKDLFNNGLNRYKYYIVEFIRKREQKRYEKWILTPEGKKNKYKHLFKDA